MEKMEAIIKWLGRELDWRFLEMGAMEMLLFREAPL
jgi:hypothetical protein